MAFLPPVPDNNDPRVLRDYLVALVRELGEELDDRPVLQEGQIIVAEDKPLTVYVNGVAYRLGVDTIPPMQSAGDALTDSDLDVNAGEVVTIQTDPVLRDSDLAENGGSIPELDRNNLFAGTQSVANPILLDGEGWTAPTLLNGWVNYGGIHTPAGYRKLPSGLVVIKGIIKDGTTASGTVMFTLPAGYRPAERLILTTLNDSTLGRVSIDGNGDVLFHTPSSSSSWLAINFSFFAEQ